MVWPADIGRFNFIRSKEISLKLGSDDFLQHSNATINCLLQQIASSKNELLELSLLTTCQ